MVCGPGDNGDRFNTTRSDALFSPYSPAFATLEADCPKLAGVHQTRAHIVTVFHSTKRRDGKSGKGNQKLGQEITEGNLCTESWICIFSSDCMQTYVLQAYIGLRLSVLQSVLSIAFHINAPTKTKSRAINQAPGPKQVHTSFQHQNDTGYCQRLATGPLPHARGQHY